MRFPDSTQSKASTDHYRKQAEMCRQMAETAISPYKEDWLQLAEKWAKMAQASEHSNHPARTGSRNPAV